MREVAVSHVSHLFDVCMSHDARLFMCSAARAPVGTASNNSNIVTTNAAVPSNWFPLVSAEVVATPPDTCAICLGHIHHPAITPCK